MAYNPINDRDKKLDPEVKRKEQSEQKKAQAKRNLMFRELAASENYLDYLVELLRRGKVFDHGDARFNQQDTYIKAQRDFALEIYKDIIPYLSYQKVGEIVAEVTTGEKPK